MMYDVGIISRKRQFRRAVSGLAAARSNGLPDGLRSIRKLRLEAEVTYEKRYLREAIPQYCEVGLEFSRGQSLAQHF